MLEHLIFKAVTLSLKNAIIPKRYNAISTFKNILPGNLIYRFMPLAFSVLVVV